VPAVSLMLPESGAMVGAPQVNGLSDDEQSTLLGLAFKLTTQNIYSLLRYAYYDGLQRMQNLGISVPPQLAGVRTVVDWPRICVDPLVQRAVPDGFRLAGATDVDSELLEHWHANEMDAEAPLAFLDSLVTGRGYMIVGSPDVDGDSPLVTVESPSNLALSWDPRTRRPTCAYQSYEVEGVFRAVLYLPDQTISMSRAQNSQWLIDDRDEHNFGEVPVVRFPNRARTLDREGRSEITAPIMNTTDSACRSLLGMEIAREVYSIPRLAILGANESDFVDASGAPKTAIDMAMNKILALERDEDGNAPTLQQLTAFDPSVFTRIIDEHAQLMSSYTGFPPSYFGQTSTANPASADAIRVAENGLVRRAEQVQGQFTGPLRQVMKLVWRFAHDGADVPEEIRRMAVDWQPAATQTPAATTDAVAKQIQVGAIPATSDVTLSRLGYSAVERERLDIDRKVDVGAQVLAELSSSLQIKEARAAGTVAQNVRKTPPAAATVEAARQAAASDAPVPGA
jgi:hypothetical protein